MACANLAVPERAMVPRLDRMSSLFMPTPVSLHVGRARGQGGSRSKLR